MATYVNLSVNQGLINKAKSAQLQNRKSIDGSKPAAAKKAAVEDQGKKFGTEYQRRKVGADLPEEGVGYIGTECTYNVFEWSDLLSFRVAPSPLFTYAQEVRPDIAADRINLMKTRTYFCGDGSQSVNFDMTPFLVLPPFYYTISQPSGENQGRLNEVILPAGGKSCVILVGLQTKEILSSAYAFNTYVASYFATETTIREIWTPLRLASMFGSNLITSFNAGVTDGIFSDPQVLPSGQGWYGWNNDVYAESVNLIWPSGAVDPYIGQNYSPDVFDGINRHLDSLDRDPSKMTWYYGPLIDGLRPGPAEKNIVITDDNRDVLAPGRRIADAQDTWLAWATSEGGPPTSADPYALFRLPYQIQTNVITSGAGFNAVGIPVKDAIAGIEGKQSIQQQHPSFRWRGKFVSTPPIVNLPDPRSTLRAVGGASTYALGVPGVFYTEFSNYLRNPAPSEREPNIPPPEDQSNYICFTDWGVPEYCIEQLLLLGYRAEDLS